MSKVWEANYSFTANNVRPSPIREILAVIKQPGMISFAGGMPAPEVFPIDKFYEGAHVLKDDGANVLQYGRTEGYPPLKEFLANWTGPRMGRVADLEEMLITTGSQQALDLFSWAMIDRGDTVITENPTYPCSPDDLLQPWSQFYRNSRRWQWHAGRSNSRGHRKSKKRGTKSKIHLHYC